MVEEAGRGARDGLHCLNYDRRGRGDSGDAQPYEVRREVEDIAALVEEAGGTTYVFGLSSGGALALEAAASGIPRQSHGVKPAVLAAALKEYFRDAGASIGGDGRRSAGSTAEERPTPGWIGVQ